MLWSRRVNDICAQSFNAKSLLIDEEINGWERQLNYRTRGTTRRNIVFAMFINHQIYLYTILIYLIINSIIHYHI